MPDINQNAIEPCGGCGNSDPAKRCIGCLHPFTPTMPDINKTDLVDRLRAQADSMEKNLLGDSGIRLTEADCMREAAAEISRLREALKPFAKAAEDIDDNNHDRWEMWEHPASMNIHVADMRRARTALEASNGRS